VKSGFIVKTAFLLLKMTWSWALDLTCIDEMTTFDSASGAGWVAEESAVVETASEVGG